MCMKKPNRVLQFAHEQTTRAWLRFQLLGPTTSLDPNQPASYLIEAQGERGDGTVFAVRLALDKVKFDLLSGQEALMVAVDRLNKTLQQLQTYTGCPCKEGEPCERHRQLVH